MVHILARQVMSLGPTIVELEALVEGRLRERPHVEAITSMPGIGDMRGAEFIVAVPPTRAAHAGGFGYVARRLYRHLNNAAATAPGVDET
ncbi:hypothetical protein PUR61_15915 [Streptomyces sp. BE20]|uniref:hypothetical protein n=1 Tax=unclassified Streptomyces TaxID=2593676 RepID=UPI002E786F28|nr:MULTISPECIES: hypothetical protein [unclassified Streptomyces]MED7949014.1 hypothetical protein [Streptomyces sp. BE303]MEE1823666.1 hypothetical protein [Streptomyces sp. BE20]